MGRWAAGLAFGAMAFFLASIVSFLGGYPLTGMAFVFLAPISMFAAMAITLYSVLAVKCSGCGERFFSITFLVWPFENKCANCGAASRTD